MRLPSRDPDARPEQATVAADELSRLREALEALPKRQRVAITLFGFNGMNLVETAETMGCAIGTVKSSLHRAREKLSHALGEGQRD
jgi:RNA polymerase sigma-70 factor (ECF subfamily)